MQLQLVADVLAVVIHRADSPARPYVQLLGTDSMAAQILGAGKMLRPLPGYEAPCVSGAVWAQTPSTPVRMSIDAH